MTGRRPRPRGTRPSAAPGSRTRSLVACKRGPVDPLDPDRPEPVVAADQLERRRAGRRRQLVAEAPRADRRSSPRRGRPLRRSARGAGRSGGSRAARACCRIANGSPRPGTAQPIASRLRGRGRSARTSSVNGSSRGASRRSPSPSPVTERYVRCGQRSFEPRSQRARLSRAAAGAMRAKATGTSSGAEEHERPRAAVRPQFQCVSPVGGGQAPRSRAGRPGGPGPARPSSSASPSRSGSWSTSATCWPVPGPEAVERHRQREVVERGGPEPRDGADRQGRRRSRPGSTPSRTDGASGRAGARSRARPGPRPPRPRRPRRRARTPAPSGAGASGAAARAGRAAAPAPRGAIRVRRSVAVSVVTVGLAGRSSGRSDVRPSGTSCAKSTRRSGPG